MEVLIIGYGSIGKQHAKNILALGHTPVILTRYPISSDGIRFILSVDDVKDIEAAVICSPTDRHLSDFISICKKIALKKILVEKPIVKNYEETVIIQSIAQECCTDVYVGYDLRFVSKLSYLKRQIPMFRDRIRLVKIHCGQYLPEWRPGTDYRKSYSSSRELGGGVDLDLSHELDYMLWLFGKPDETEFIFTDKISSLEIDSPDYFKGIFRYKNFIIDVELDYFRKLDRKLIIIGENENIAELDFIEDKLTIKNNVISFGDYSIRDTLALEISDFLSENHGNLCTLNESIEVLKILNNKNV